MRREGDVRSHGTSWRNQGRVGRGKHGKTGENGENDKESARIISLLNIAV